MLLGLLGFIMYMLLDLACFFISSLIKTCVYMYIVPVHMVGFLHIPIISLIWLLLLVKLHVWYWVI